MKNIYKASFAALAITPLIGLFGQNTYAAMPNTFKDEIFYNCVEQNFIQDYPDEVIAETGLTNEQLGKMRELVCFLEGITDTTGLELMTSLERLDVSYNNLTTIDISKNTSLLSLYTVNSNISSIDVSHNPNLTILGTDSDVVIDTGIIPEKDGDKLKYDLSKLKFLDPEAVEAAGSPYVEFHIFDHCETSLDHDNIYKVICTSVNVAYDEENRILYVNNLSLLKDSPQITAGFRSIPFRNIISADSAPSRSSYSDIEDLGIVEIDPKIGEPFAKLRLAEPKSEPESDSDEILSPDTGVSSRNSDAAGAIFPVFGISLGALIALLLYFCHKRDNLKLE